MKILRTISLCFMMMIFCATKAQPPASWPAIMELVRLSGHYQHASSLSFSVDIKYADSTNLSNPVEQMNAQYRLHKGLFYSVIDSTEFIQGNSYYLKVNHYDSVISVHSRREAADMFNIPVKDSLFWSATEAVVASDANDSVRLVRIVFKPGARFTSYEITYVKQSLNIKEVKCYFLASQPGIDEHLFPSGKAVIHFLYSNYSKAIIDGNWFKEDKYISYQEGQFIPKPTYSGYHIETNISK